MVHEVGVVVRVREVGKAHHLFGRVGEYRLVNAGSTFFCVVLGRRTKLKKEARNGIPLSEHSILG